MVTAFTTLNHGHNRRGQRTTEYQIWVGIRKRVNNPKDKLYPYYGGRGITYDPRWESFLTFLEDVGYRPSTLHSLDRIDNDMPYQKDNVRWATKKEQALNRRSNLPFQGIPLKLWCEQHGYGDHYKSIHRWVTSGKSVSYIQQRAKELWG